MNSSKQGAAITADYKLTLTHRFNVPPAQVFDAWLDADSVGCWLFATADGVMLRTELIPHIGGGFTIVEKRGQTHASHFGIFVEMDRPRRLSFTFTTEREQKPSLVTIDIKPIADGCNLTLTHEMDPQWQGYADRIRSGWSMILDKLAEYLPSDREILATLILPAPRELVFAQWSDPRQIAQWWGPRGFTNTIQKMNFRPGGIWQFIMHGPDGVDYQNKIVFAEIKPPSLLVYDHVSGPHFHATATFADMEDKTRLTLRMLFESASLREQVARQFGAVEGLHQTLARLSESLASLKASGVVGRVLTLHRIMDAPAEQVYRAWIEPGPMAQWWGPKDFTNPVCELDAQPGGKLHIEMQSPDGARYPCWGVFHELSSPQRLVLTTSAFADSQGHPQLETLNTAVFTEQNGKTILDLRVVVNRATPEVANPLAGMEQGWSQSLDRLAELAATFTPSSDRPFVISRTFVGSPKVLYQAWTDPHRMCQWFGPKGFTNRSLQNDLRPGGIYHYCLRSHEGSEMWGKWVYREIVPQEKLVFVCSFSDAKGNITRHPLSETWPLEMLSTITFAQENGHTTLTIQWEPIHASAAEHKTFAAGFQSMQAGWNGTLEQLAEYLASSQT